ncbi:MAG: DUF2794 domain-containing protein [Rhodospirillaceae bacterium]|mgnify:FL=1|nr:DUF2794 domain-containing protein [Rhodospirillaceae bacterium]MBT5374329.1 DUF2794 domain-containing protein [Rhodospirillaceae bacterium]MBT5658786.1 DUF2794 domain-containing protein [Rhodospirillaceae bacterium]MBT5752580.1 DUF2794 domain-containing protein [Rhodospirillaceae bacterium]
MSNLLNISDFKTPAQPGTSIVSFSRQELSALMAIYATRVAQGEWRDYSITLNSRMAVFSIFRHSSDQPLYTFAKMLGLANRPNKYILFNGRKIFRSSTTIEDLVSQFHRQSLHLVSKDK